MTGKQPKQGNVKLTLSVKTETRDSLRQCAKNKLAIGKVIDNIFLKSDQTCICGNPDPIIETLDTKKKLCEKCTIEYLKTRLTK